MNRHGKDYYQILGLDREAKGSEIKAAYRRLALQYHPDRNSGRKEAEEKFKQINDHQRREISRVSKEEESEIYSPEATYHKRDIFAP